MNADHLTILHQIPEARLSHTGFTITHSAALVYPVLPKGIKFPSTCSFLLPWTKGLLGGSPSWDITKGSSQNHCPVKRRLATRMSFADLQTLIGKAQVPSDAGKVSHQQQVLAGTSPVTLHSWITAEFSLTLVSKYFLKALFSSKHIGLQTQSWLWEELHILPGPGFTVTSKTNGTGTTNKNRNHE